MAAGIPTMALYRAGISRSDMGKSFRKEIGFREDGSFGVIYEYSFNTDEIRKPLQKTALGGWLDLERRRFRQTMSLIEINVLPLPR